jgi:hypothetical protein
MFDDSGPVVIKIGANERFEAVPAPNRFRVRLDEFSESIMTGKPPTFPAEDGLANTAALVALSAAAREGTVEDVKQTG